MKVQNIGAVIKNRSNFKANNKDFTAEVKEADKNEYTQNPLVDRNYGILATKSISFGGALIQESLASKQLSAAFSKIMPDEIAIVTSDIKEAIKGIKDFDLSDINFYAKRMFVINDNKIGKGFIAYKGENGAKKIINIGEDSGNILVSDKKLSVFPPNYTQEVYDGSEIFINGAQFNLHDNVSNAEDLMSTVESYPLTIWDPHCVEDANKRHITEALTLFNEPEVKRLSFADVGGQKGAIEQLKQSIIRPLRYPEAFRDMSNKGIILYGPPGTGKTLLANAAANEAHVNFMNIDPNEMQNMYVGETERQWREVFDKAVEAQPCVLFIDEADAAMKKREGSSVSRFDDKVVNQLLAKMTEITNGGANVFVILATNKIELLDSAILRSGRFGTHIEVKKPDLDGCKDILRIHSKGKPFDNEVDKELLAKKFFESGCTGADFPFILESARNNAYSRLNFFEKMDNGTFDVKKDLANYSIKNEDFEKAFEKFNSSKNGEKSQERIKIKGYQDYI